MAEESKSLLENKLFLQYLAGTGAAIGSGESPAAAMGGITMQNIQSQNFMKLLKQLLGPDGTKGTFDSSGISLKIPKESSMFGSILGGDEGMKSDYFSANPSLAPAAPSTPAAPAAAPVFGGRSTVANPFDTSLSGTSISPSDLAGLTTQDITAAIGAKNAADQLKQQSARDLVDSLYKGAVIKREERSTDADIKYKESLIEKAKADIENDKPIYKTENGMLLNAKDYLAYQKMVKEDQTPAVKNYEYALKQGFKGSFVDFQDNAKTTHKKDYDEAVSGGYKGTFNTWMLDMAKAGAINLGQKVEEKKAFSELTGQLYFNDPKWTTELDKYMNSEDVQNTLMRVPGKSGSTEYTAGVTKAKAAERVKFVEGKISAGGGEIQDVKFDKDGKTMIWTVKWPSGDIKTIKQVVK